MLFMFIESSVLNTFRYYIGLVSSSLFLGPPGMNPMNPRMGHPRGPGMIPMNPGVSCTLFLIVLIVTVQLFGYRILTLIFLLFCHHKDAFTL